MSTPKPNPLGYAVLLAGVAFIALAARDKMQGAPVSSLPPALENTARAALASKNPLLIRGAAVTLRLQGYTDAANALEAEAQKYDQGSLT